MWIFGYGSLMFDGWEARHGCTESVWADLAGYCRAFNKKSVSNWGSEDAPGLTLNLKPDNAATCRGMAFCFADGDGTRPMLEMLRKREACGPAELELRLDDGRKVRGLVYIYAAKNLLGDGVTLAQKTAMVAKAKGTSGVNRDYVRRTFEGLDKIGVRDPAVTELWDAVRAAG